MDTTTGCSHIAEPTLAHPGWKTHRRLAFCQRQWCSPWTVSMPPATRTGALRHMQHPRVAVRQRWRRLAVACCTRLQSAARSGIHGGTSCAGHAPGAQTKTMVAVYLTVWIRYTCHPLNRKHLIAGKDDQELVWQNSEHAEKALMQGLLCRW